MLLTANEVIKKLNLVPLPEEGGFYRQTYKSAVTVEAHSQGAEKRAASTAIYFMLTPESFSALHRLKTDEVYHFYAGDPMQLIQIDESGFLKQTVMGFDLMSGHLPQVVVPKGVWQGSRLVEGGRWALLGCTVAPAFEFMDFELGSREMLLQQFPEARSLILELTRNESQ